MTECPATMCPYMGADESGSAWTGAKDAACESDCGWNHDGGCIVTGELVADILGDDDLPDGEWPACPKADVCQWQDELADGVPCPPRLAVMRNETPEGCLL